MQTTSQRFWLGLIIIGAIVSALLIVSFDKYPKPVSASVAQGNEYHSTTTPLVGFSQDSCIASTTSMLGSVIITASSTGSFVLYDATTSDATKRTVAATTTLASFPGSAIPGTYTFDEIVNTGCVLIHTIGSQGSSTITTR